MNFYVILLVSFCVYCVCGIPVENELVITSTKDAFLDQKENLTSNKAKISDDISVTINDLTADIATCNHNFGKLGDCVKDAINRLVSRIKTDEKNSNEYTKLDPFILNRTTLQYSNGPVAGRLTMKNGAVFGLADTRIKAMDIKINENKIKVRFLAVLPLMTFLGNYKADMQLNRNIRMRPKGQFNVTLVGLSMSAKAEGVLYTSDGYRFARLNKIDADPKIRDFKVKIGGLFNEAEMNDVASNIATQYWRQVYQIMVPEMRPYLSPLLLSVLNEALKQIPVDNFVQEYSPISITTESFVL